MKIKHGVSIAGVTSEITTALKVAGILWGDHGHELVVTAGTEKPMEFAFLNAIMRSERFPAYDPWMAGYSISYYHFGYIMVATLAKFARIPTSYAFNLGIAMLFALTASGAFSIVYNMCSMLKRQVRTGYIFQSYRSQCSIVLQCRHRSHQIP